MRIVLALEASSMTCAVAVGAGERPGVQRASRRDDPDIHRLRRTCR